MLIEFMFIGGIFLIAGVAFLVSYIRDSLFVNIPLVVLLVILILFGMGIIAFGCSPAMHEALVGVDSCLCDTCSEKYIEQLKTELTTGKAQIIEGENGTQYLITYKDGERKMTKVDVINESDGTKTVILLFEDGTTRKTFSVGGVEAEAPNDNQPTQPSENETENNEPQCEGTIVEDKDGNKYLITYDEDGNPVITEIE